MRRHFLFSALRKPLKRKKSHNDMHHDLPKGQNDPIYPADAEATLKDEARLFPLEVDINGLGRPRPSLVICLIDDSICDLCVECIKGLLCLQGFDSLWQRKARNSIKENIPCDLVFPHYNSLSKSTASTKATCRMCMIVADFQSHTDSKEVVLACTGRMNSMFKPILEQDRSYFFLRHSIEITQRQPIRDAAFEFVLARNGQRCLQRPLRDYDDNSGYPKLNLAPTKYFAYPRLDRMSEECLTQVRAWYSTCSSEHEKCLRCKRLLLSRLLDLEYEGPDLDSIHLVETSSFSSDSVQYVALSYCWGKVLQFSTDSSNFFERTHSGISFHRLPPVVQDAVRITKGVGIRYIWVDSLCIIQNNEEDWKQEADRMSMVYEGCTFTLSVLSSESVNNGFLENRTLKPVPLGKVKIDHGGKTGYPRLFLRGIPRSIDAELSRCPLSQRAWPLQERLLPPAVLHYGRDQLIWECNTCLQSETGKTQTTTHVLPRIPLTVKTEPTSANIWDDCVIDFTKRDITIPSDRLPAILGVASRLRRERMRDGRYVAGHWENDLKFGLLWRAQQRYVVDRQKSKEPNRQVSTWSWAHRDVKVRFTVPANGVSVLSKAPRFYIHDPEKDMQSRQSFTTVPSCAIDLEGYFQKVNAAAMFVNSSNPANPSFWAKDNGAVKDLHYGRLPGAGSWWAFDDGVLPTATSPYYSMRMVEVTQAGSLWTQTYYLVLREAAKDDENTAASSNCYLSNIFVRVGILCLNMTLSAESSKQMCRDIICEDGTSLLYDGKWKEILLV